MQRDTSSPGPEIGWAFGAAGFVVSALAGLVLDAGLGFVLLLAVLWAGLGALFAFLVERSTVEEHDRLDELRNTRLATLALSTDDGVEHGRADTPHRDHAAA
ncbi:hypothetical protein [Patulibacter sp.]|uniref:hypothetical protein n=1 Tax=Patulibacter sp. TaxID=1912859 RepID=UPI002715B13D|nr:hypothetical protein [Patulibacter sp.]MDO9410586.1 hypothetical protein [Patulibacter sp.]